MPACTGPRRAPLAVWNLDLYRGDSCDFRAYGSAIAQVVIQHRVQMKVVGVGRVAPQKSVS